MTPGQPTMPLALVADNDQGISSMLSETLVRRGVRCEAVADGDAALRRLSAGGVALLVTDLDMPGVDGHDLLRRLTDVGSSPPVLVVSGYLDPELSRELQALPPVRGVLAKPFDLFRFADLAWRLATGAGAELGPA
ncbi:MAG: response regulator [Planctomycetota bacterium]